LIDTVQNILGAFSNVLIFKHKTAKQALKWLKSSVSR